eukprot:TRINITY_DN1828_c0_g1_i2.p1 TRINITY_DN1828_c0_g1~~TRINITY_DN1828_c0_g1_i2.p1  ORF type:complete len:186 (+),score=50.19 TRINITY_DN1828_c0_g1_i2:156-713(+)
MCIRDRYQRRVRELGSQSISTWSSCCARLSGIMGGSLCKDKLEGTPFKEEDMEEFEACTSLTRSEAIQIWQIFHRAANPHKDFDGDDDDAAGDEDPLQQRLDKEKFATVAQFRNNPFSGRIVDIFSERGDETLTFEEFLDVFSVFSARASKEEKIKVAFRLYDFDDNGFIDPMDLEMVRMKECRL